MRILGILSATMMLGGCIHLDAKPMAFTCGDLLDKNSEIYQAVHTQLQRDAGYDECAPNPDGKPGCGGAGLTAAHSRPVFFAGDPITEALGQWKRSDALGPSATRPAVGEGPPMLMLSGGGGWGAFGAGYLNALKREDWAVVTGVSTGALQAIFVAAGDYPELAKAYRIKDGGELARKNGVIGIVLKGSELDMGPLRQKVMAYLLPADGSESPLLRIRRADAPHLAVAMVEARSGDLVVVHITDMVRKTLGASGQPAPGELRRVAQCVGGVALASSSIPVRLTPVQIDGRTYVDGGVRSSVFDAGVGVRLATFSEGRPEEAEPRIYVIRNGPTIVFRDADDRDRPGTAEVDARPDAMRVGLRGYSTIVNQNELMSIASLRISYPRGPIRVISADGFNSRKLNPVPCGPRPAAMFDAAFMGCLVDWGEYRARTGPSWIDLDEIPPKPEPATAPRRPN